MMKLGFRWFGDKYDTVKLWQLRQIPGTKGVVTSLYGVAPGAIWGRDKIHALKSEVEEAGLEILCIESVNVADAIKAATYDRDRCIENYIKSLENLAEEGIHTVCYNFMPVFDWTRTDLNKMREDGATVLSYDHSVVESVDPQEMFDIVDSDSSGHVLPGWEPERLGKVKELFGLYKGMDEDTLFANLVYFLKAIMPTCDKYDVDMCIHIDDPCWSVFGLPRIVRSKEHLHRIMDAVPNVHNGVTLCTGSLSSDPSNNIPDIIRSLKGRIHFAHIRNTRQSGTYRVFEEAAHISCDGYLDMYEIMKAFYDIGYDGPFRPDHGRNIWGEMAMPGYGLYDRALGSQYLLGLEEAIIKANKK